MKNLIWMICLFAALTTSCYRMPTEDDYCLIPTVNNPDLTREKPNNMLPNMSY